MSGLPLLAAAAASAGRGLSLLQGPQEQIGGLGSGDAVFPVDDEERHAVRASRLGFRYVVRSLLIRRSMTVNPIAAGSCSGAVLVPFWR